MRHRREKGKASNRQGEVVCFCGKHNLAEKVLRTFCRLWPANVASLPCIRPLQSPASSRGDDGGAVEAVEATDAAVLAFTAGTPSCAQALLETVAVAGPSPTDPSPSTVPAHRK